MQADYRIIQGVVRREIEQIVSRAAQGRGFLRAGEQAYRIVKAYPNSGLTGEEVVNEIIATAATAASPSKRAGGPWRPSRLRTCRPRRDLASRASSIERVEPDCAHFGNATRMGDRG